MYMIENLRRMLVQTTTIKDYVELASEIHVFPSVCSFDTPVLPPFSKN